MTSSESQPRTRAGKALLGNILGTFRTFSLPSLRNEEGFWVERILAIEAEAAAGPPASAERVTRESLAAALEAEKVVGGVSARYGAFNKAYWERLADRILAALPEAAVLALPSPAPEPPPAEDDIDRTILEGAAEENRGKDWRSISEPFEERAAEPAPDPQLVREALTLLEGIGAGTSNGPSLDIATARNRLRSFLQARESGGEG